MVQQLRMVDEFASHSAQAFSLFMFANFRTPELEARGAGADSNRDDPLKRDAQGPPASFHGKAISMHQNNNEPTPHTSQTTPEPTKETSGGGEGFDVMNILADVENHIQRIKTAQRAHDEELNTLEERFHSLKNAEREVEVRRKQVIEERGRLEQVQNALKEERAAFEQECAARSSEFESERESLARERTEITQKQQEITERFQGLEKQFAELSALEQEIGRERASLETESQQTQARHRQLIEQLDERQAELDQRDSSISEQRRAMEAREAELNAAVERMQGEVKAFDARATEAEAKASEAIDRTRAAEEQLETRSQELARMKDELESTQASLKEARELAAEQQSAFEEEREQATEMMAELEEAVTKTKRAHESTTSELDSLRSDHESLTASHSKSEQLRGQLEQQIAQLNEKLTQRDKSLADSQEKLKLAGAKLKEFSEVLREQASQLEQAAASKITIRQQEQEIEHLCNELARYRLAADPEVLDRKDQRIAELTEALRQARGQNPDDGDDSILEQQVLELSTAVDERQLIIEQLQVQLQHALQRAHDDASSEAREAGDAARVTERDARIEELTAEVNRLEHEMNERAEAALAANESSTAGAEEIALLKQRILELESSGGSDAADSARIDELEQKAAHTAALQSRVQELESELQQARSKSGKSSSGSSKQLDEKVQRIRAAAEHLQRRRSRLQRARKLLELRKPAGESHSQSTTEQIELAKQSISEARSALAASEREMMRRWARSRAAVAVSFVTVLIGMLAAGSWFMADHFYPAKSTASVTLEARTKDNKMLEGEDGARWSAWHAEMLGDHAFRNTLAKRMEERQLPQYGSKTAIDNVMKNDVTIDAIKPGEITITMAGQDKQQLTHALDTLASTLATASTREAGKRSDAARTVIRGERNDTSTVQYAQMTGVNLEDERLMYSAIIFGATGLVALLCGVGVYTRLVKAKRVFEEEGRLS